jgi:hypothetical protein
VSVEELQGAVHDRCCEQRGREDGGKKSKNEGIREYEEASEVKLSIFVIEMLTNSDACKQNYN